MKKKLKEIASIQTGYSFRSRLVPSIRGDVAVVQMKDVAGNTVDSSSLIKTDMADLAEHHVLEAGDIIFRSRGLTNTCAILDTDIGTGVLASPLLRIRVTAQYISPAYLHWYLNQQPAQSYFSTHSRGTAQKMVSQQAVEHLEIPVPAIQHQLRIVELAELGAKEIEILEAILEKRRLLNSATLLRLTTQGDIQ